MLRYSPSLSSSTGQGEELASSWLREYKSPHLLPLLLRERGGVRGLDFKEVLHGSEKRGNRRCVSS